MTKEAIILAGGLGTRLRSVVSDVPKCMAQVAGRPFLYYIIQSLLKAGVEKFIFSVGYKSEVIIEFIEQEYPTINYQFAVETEPLGTGGAILLACRLASQKEVLILNGDTFFDIDIEGLFRFHIEHQSSCTLCLKPMHNFERYGVVAMDEHQVIRSFKEKQFFEEGLINGGVYLLDKDYFQGLSMPEKFSFEKLFLEGNVEQGLFYAFLQDGYFIDIGIPEDFEKAQQDFENFKA